MPDLKISMKMQHDGRHARLMYGRSRANRVRQKMDLAKTMHVSFQYVSFIANCYCVHIHTDTEVNCRAVNFI